jgi:hypothetical protein
MYLQCPLCDHTVGRAASESGVAYVQYRCRNRACEARPVITFRLADGAAEEYGLVDRRTLRAVS